MARRSISSSHRRVGVDAADPGLAIGSEVADTEADDSARMPRPARVLVAHSSAAMRDILDEFEQQRRSPTYPEVAVEMGMLVEDRSSHFTGDVVRWSAEGVTLQDRYDYVRHFGWKPGGFLVDGRPVTLVRPKVAVSATQRLTASGSPFVVRFPVASLT